MKFNGEIHPVADLFPMLPEDELRDLAEDIKIRGQLQPIVLDAEGRIIDGRNRFAACKLAGVEPEFMTYDGDDPDGYALAVNISRRHMTKGQQAVVVAKSLLVSNNLNQSVAAKAFGISQPRVAQANVILEFAPDLVNGVLGGLERFDAAYETAKERKQAQQQRATEAESIREEAPDLADAVAEESMTLADAKEALKKRQEDAERALRVAAIDVLVDESGGDAPNFSERVQAGQLTWAEAENLANQWKKEFDEAVDRNCRRIESVASGWAALSRLLDAPDDHFNQAVTAKLGATLGDHIAAIRNEIADKAEKWEGNLK